MAKYLVMILGAWIVTNMPKEWHYIWGFIIGVIVWTFNNKGEEINAHK